MGNLGITRFCTLFRFIIFILKILDLHEFFRYARRWDCGVRYGLTVSLLNGKKEAIDTFQKEVEEREDDEWHQVRTTKIFLLNFAICKVKSCKNYFSEICQQLKDALQHRLRYFKEMMFRYITVEKVLRTYFAKL